MGRFIFNQGLGKRFSNVSCSYMTRIIREQEGHSATSSPFNRSSYPNKNENNSILPLRLEIDLHMDKDSENNLFLHHISYLQFPPHHKKIR
jgi:hypothetical protein